MRYILAFTFVVFFNLCLNSLKANESLTIKQELERIKQEVSDLNMAVFNKSFDKKNLNITENKNDTERFTSIDIRIYDLEKDIKNLTLQFEEIMFKFDDISNYLEKIETEINFNLEEIKKNTKNQASSSNANEENVSTEVKEKNTLGKLVLTEDAPENSNNEETFPEEETINQEPEIISSTPEEQLQIALDLMMKKNYKKSKLTLEKFIENFPENQLSGSAHFWLGKIYLFESNFRKAAIVFGEGVQKFPESIKAAEMYYELSKSLKEMNKFSEACKTLEILNQNYKGNKFTKDPEKLSEKLECKVEN
tara:strand:- start:2545 stop:3468 length:924 start_codon:yes stop_codon:yes gene_type:complete